MNNYSHFKTQSGKNIFYYNNDNILFNENLQPINSFNYSDDHIQYAKQNHGVTFKSNKPQALRIQLGHACNYSCTYCMQKDIGNPDERPKRDRLDDFFDSIRKNLDL
jgi:sulfatase maturation enzyme AslB (radical SAM superfamily)